jgi:polar amino acid transport system substrate-binding protein
MTHARLVALALCLAGAAHALDAPQSDTLGVAELAPTATLRVALQPTDPFLASREGQGGGYVGLAPDLANLLAAKLGKPVQTVHYANAAALTASIGTGEWDIAFLALDPALRGRAAVSRPYLEVDYGYLVAAGNGKLRSAADVDRSGVRIAVPQPGQARRLLAGAVRQAEVVPVRGGKIALAEVFSTEGADTYAESLQMLSGIASQARQYRMLEGRFAVAQYVILVPQGHAEALRYIDAFLDAAAASGEIDAAIGRAGLQFVRVPAPATAHGVDRATTQRARGERVSGETADRAP